MDYSSARSIHNGVSSSCSDMDELEASCKSPSDKASSILCWNGISSINDLNSSYITSMKDMPQNVFSDSSTNLPSSPVSGNTEHSQAFQDNLHQVTNVITDEMINVPSTSINLDSDIKMDHLNYMLSGSIDGIDVNVSANSVMEFDQSVPSAAISNSNLLQTAMYKCNSSNLDVDTMSFLTKASDTNDSSSHLNLESFSTLTTSPNLDSTIDEPMMDINSSHLNDHCAMTTSDASLQQFSDSDDVLLSPEMQKLLSQASDPIKTSANHLTSVVPSSVSVSKFLLNVTNPAKTNFSNSGSSSTIIVPSIKNTITCPAPVQLPHVPEVNNILVSDQSLPAGNYLNSVPEAGSNVNDGALVEQVTCLKCRLCQFITLDKNEIDSHIKTVHGTQQSNQRLMSATVTREAQVSGDLDKNILKATVSYDSHLKSNSTQKKKLSSVINSSNLDVNSAHLIIRNEVPNFDSQNHGINFYVTADQNSVSPLCSASSSPQGAEHRTMANPELKFPISCDPVLASVSKSDFTISSSMTKLLKRSTEKVQNKVVSEGTPKFIHKFLCCFCAELFDSISECLNHIKKHELYQQTKPKNSKEHTTPIANKVGTILSSINSKDITTVKCLKTVPNNLALTTNQLNLTGEAIPFVFQQNVAVPLNSTECINKLISLNHLDVNTNESILSNQAQSTGLPKIVPNNLLFISANKSEKNVEKLIDAGCVQQICPICRKVFKTSELLANHVASEHQSQVIDQANFVTNSRCVTAASSTFAQPCEIKKKDWNTNENWTKEVLQELPVKNSVKELEDVETPTEFRKRFAIKKKTKADGAYICDFKRCNISYRIEKNLTYHKRCHIHDKKAGGFCCPECEVKTDLWRNMSTHLWKKHQVDLELYSCEFCSYKTWSFSLLHTSHRLIHGVARAFLCDVCGKNFKTYKQMQNHKIIHSSKKKSRLHVPSHPCNVCEKVFRHSRILQLHKEAVHDKIRPFLCNFCGHFAANRSSLKMHLRLHTGEKPYTCDMCNYKSSDHNSLRRHKMTHSGEKPYKCPHCHYGCIQSSTYKQHLKNKHSELNNGLMCLCNLCDFKSMKHDALEIHILEAHNGVAVSKVPFMENDSSLDNSVSINLRPANDGSITLTSKDKPTEVLGNVQVPDSGSIQTPDMDASLENMVSTDVCFNETLTSS